MTADQEQWIVTMVHGGYLTAEQIVEAVLEDDSDDVDEEDRDRAKIEAFVEAKMTERRHALQLAGAADYDRLHAAFDELEDRGILVRENYWCCQTCAFHGIEEEVADGREAGEEIRGYVYFHSQDTDRAVEIGELMLRFGGTTGEPGTLKSDATKAIGEEVVAALEDEHLYARWSGSPADAILLPITWDKPPPVKPEHLH